ncbi:MAG: TetR/AcrR family transcriptional regulator [Pseudomonadota bacterium]
MNIIHFSVGRGLVKGQNELYSLGMNGTYISPKQQQKSSAIIAAARTHFATRGFESTKLSDVAKDAGVAVGTIYLRYKSKAELLSGVLSEVELAFCNAMDTDDIWASPFPNRFTLIAKAVLETARSQSDLPALMALSSFAEQTDPNNKRAMISTIQRHVQNGIETGELRSNLDLPLVAYMAHGMVEGAMRELMTNSGRLPEETVESITDTFSSWLLKT